MKLTLKFINIWELSLVLGLTFISGFGSGLSYVLKDWGYLFLFASCNLATVAHIIHIHEREKFNGQKNETF